MADHFQRVYKSPINTSISKNLYSFPKTQRFEKARQSPCQRSFYNVKKGAMTARSTSFGYGDKVDMINREGVPPPGAYNQIGNFGSNHTKKRGFSFGTDRRQIFSQELDHSSPGPGKYDKVYNNYSHISFSMRSKYEDPLDKHKNLLGPGQYNYASSLNNTGNYFNSKHRGSLCGKIGKSSRFQEDRAFSPGPGKYNDHLSMNRTGVYFNSRIASNFVKSFQGTPRFSMNELSQTPGPGAYYRFSQFAAVNKSLVK